MLEIILSPFSWLRVRYHRKWLVDWVYPLVLTAASAGVFHWFSSASANGPSMLASKLLVVSSVLPGFFIAALAAIATFHGPELDDLIPHPHAFLRTEGRTMRLTRRRFLALLFSFLCAHSLLLLVLCVFGPLVGQSISGLGFDWLYAGLRLIFGLALLLIFWQVVCAALLGLYYLGDRIHRPTS